MKPVPKPVKVAVLQGFLKLRFKAYVLLMGLLWREKARHIKLARQEEIVNKAKRAMKASGSMALRGPSAAGVAAEAVKAEAAAGGSPSLPASPEKEIPDGKAGGSPSQSPPVEKARSRRLPRYRMLATVPEMRVLMQQGVAETPSFLMYLNRGGLKAYEQQVGRLRERD